MTGLFSHWKISLMSTKFGRKIWETEARCENDIHMIQDMIMRTGLIWLRLDATGGLQLIQYFFYRRLGLSKSDATLSASIEKFFLMALVRTYIFIATCHQ
jgi:hypothetical protein